MARPASQCQAQRASSAATRPRRRGARGEGAPPGRQVCGGCAQESRVHLKRNTRAANAGGANERDGSGRRGCVKMGLCA